MDIKNVLRTGMNMSISRIRIMGMLYTETQPFLEIILFALWIYLHWALYQEHLNIRNLNNLFVWTEFFPTPYLLDWRIPLYIYIYIYI